MRPRRQRAGIPGQGATIEAQGESGRWSGLIGLVVDAVRKLVRDDHVVRRTILDRHRQRVVDGVPTGDRALRVVLLHDIHARWRDLNRRLVAELGIELVGVDAGQVGEGA